MDTKIAIEKAARKTAECKRKMDEWSQQLEQLGDSAPDLQMIVNMAKGLLGLNKAVIALMKRLEVLESHVYGSNKGVEEKEGKNQPRDQVINPIYV